jgi:hypothetical protein
MRSEDSQGVALFHENPAFRRLAYFLSSQEFIARQEARRLDPEEARVYRRSLAGIRNYLYALERTAMREPSRISRAAAAAASVHAALRAALDPAAGETPGDALARLEAAVAELGAAAAEAAGEDRPTVFAPREEEQPESSPPVALSGQGAPVVSLPPAREGAGKAPEEFPTAAPEGATQEVSADPARGGGSASPAFLSAFAACEDLLLAAAVRHERAARIWGIWTGIFLLLALALCLYREPFFPFPGQGLSLPAGSDGPVFFRYGAALGSAVLGYALLVAALAGCWRMFRTERRLGIRIRQRAADLAAACALVAADPALREILLRGAVQSLCRNREES